MAPKYKLTYLKMKGFAEPIRFLLSYIGEDFEDVYYEREEWFKSIKSTAPWGKCPILEVDGKTVTQSIAITRYLGREAGLNGKNSWEDLRIDEIVNVIVDLRAELIKFHYEKDEKIKEAVKGPLKEIVPFYMKKLDAHIKANNGYLANGKLSWADLFFAASIDYLSHMNRSDLTADYPNVKALKETVYAMPKIKAWVDKRPETEL